MHVENILFIACSQTFVLVEMIGDIPMSCEAGVEGSIQGLVGITAFGEAEEQEEEKKTAHLDAGRLSAKKAEGRSLSVVTLFYKV